MTVKQNTPRGLQPTSPPPYPPLPRAPRRRYYWPEERVKPWLEEGWDEWEEEPPQWFTSKWVRRISTAAPPEVLPLAVLQDMAEKHMSEPGERESRSRRTLARTYTSVSGNVGVADAPASAHELRVMRSQSTLADLGRGKLVQKEKKRRANAGFVRAKQLGIWTAALAFSYLDLVTTVVVGREYLGMGTREGTRAAHVTFGMVGVSLGIQTLITHLTGDFFNLQPVAKP